MNERMARLLDLVWDRTRKGEMPWRDTTDDDVFEANLSGNSFGIAEQGHDKYRFSVYDSQGRCLEFIETYVGEQWKPETRSSNEKLADLFDIARRQALRIEENLDDLIRALS